ncbi:hypothetical protein [Aliiruegeria sabulilitoris]|uniref:hypothetical protein n=1 Tax=Aliiruegeria sabulilitoris TaxID=1510458 RepID=UPI00082FFCA6|nr:hypothetical protein [Aliiruegeria sabulilitoris]NDR58661.1 hypothetical protein [Pseudoruegeria sp. M32A2M]
MAKKDYLILIGAPKCGTTSMAAWLGSQPDMVLADQKETLYFTDFGNRSWSGPGSDFADQIPLGRDSFEAEFASNPDATLRVEASTDNLSCSVAADNIARFADREGVGEIWVVALVRDPVARIVSEYEHTLRLGWQSGNLLQSLQLEEKRIADEWHPLFRHVHRSRYATQLARYGELFGDRLRVMSFDSIRDGNERIKLLRWLGRYNDGTNYELEHLNQREIYVRPNGKRYLDNGGFAEFARAFVPKSLRPIIRRAIIGQPVGRYQPSGQEIDFIRNSLSDEINACVERPDIPTDSWTPSLFECT